MLNVEKLTAMATYFLWRSPSKQIQHIKLMKLMYIAERDHLRDYYSTITSLKFSSLEHGPVISDGLDVMDGTKPEKFWDDHIEYLKIPTRWKLKDDPIDWTDYLSDAEISTLQKVYVTYGNRTQQDLRALTHTFKEWNKMAEEKQTSFPIQLETILIEGIKLDESIAKELVDELNFYHSLSA